MVDEPRNEDEFRVQMASCTPEDMDVDLQVKENHCKISNRKVTILDISEGSHKLLYNGNGMKLKAGELFRKFLFVSSFNFCSGPADC